MCVHCSGSGVIFVPPVVAPLPPADYLVDRDDGGWLQTPEAYVIPVDSDVPPQPIPPYVFTVLTARRQ